VTEREVSRRRRERALMAKQMRDRGLTFAEIGRRLGGITRVTAYRIVKRGQLIAARRAAAGVL